jgi:hypothetical protein
VRPPRQVGDRGFLIDAAAVGVVGVAICLASDRLALMTALVPAVVAARFAAWLALPRAERDLDRAPEVLLFLIATAVGGFNDWNTVSQHRVYDYTVPTDLAGVSPIPAWMLLYWGLILRFVVTVFHYRRLAVPRAPDQVWLGAPVRSAPARIAVLLALALLTRQAIYRWFADPLASWLPFAIALVAAIVIVRPERARLRVVAAVLVIGPAVEALLIGVGHLHAYRLGWFAGVPLWIVLWWGLAALIWSELAGRLMDVLEVAPARTRAIAGRA